MAPRLPFRTATDSDRFRRSQILHVLSWFPVAKVTPSGCHADANEKSKCPHNDAMVCRDHKLKLEHALISGSRCQFITNSWYQITSKELIWEHRCPFKLKREEEPTFPVMESTNKPSGLSPTIIRSLPSGLCEECCKHNKQMIFQS